MRVLARDPVPPPHEAAVVAESFDPDVLLDTDREAMQRPDRFLVGREILVQVHGPFEGRLRKDLRDTVCLCHCTFVNIGEHLYNSRSGLADILVSAQGRPSSERPS